MDATKVYVLLLYVARRCELHVSITDERCLQPLYPFRKRRSSHAYREVYRSFIYSRKQEAESTLNEYQSTKILHLDVSL